ncbi:hypothetical protein LR48_Vigan01g239000 [Vigna angularis]|uniref:Uncharacterized protein n=1 Tax=Phaseolus angularis TaxID=3914 RepID=A0A0L9TRN5_PHAAN|nr:hypothetical protein LR48_Vigan01g239000 [Vigna angularis]
MVDENGTQLSSRQTEVEASSGAISGGEEWRFAICSNWRFGWWLVVDDSVVEIGRQCCWRDDDLASARVKMVKIGGRGIARDRVRWWRENEDEMRRTTAGEDGGDDAGWCGG